MSTESLDKRAERVNYIIKEGGELRTEMVIGLIDDLRAALAAPQAQPEQAAQAWAENRGWSIEYRPGGHLYGLFDTQDDAQAEADKVGGTARAVALYTAIAPAQRMSEEQERAGFEQWAKDHGRIFLKRAGDGYEFGYTNEAWVAWKARAAWGVKLEGGEA